MAKFARRVNGLARESEGETSPLEYTGMTMRDLAPMAQYLVWAMENQGTMTNEMIYRAVKSVCREHGRELPTQWEAKVRQTLQAHCPSRPQWNGKYDFFIYHRRGHWSCKVTPLTLEQLLNTVENSN